MLQITTEMKKLLFFIFLALALPSVAQSGTETLFPYPTAPDDEPNFRVRANYLVEHFWDRCNFGSAFLSKGKMATAFSDFAAFMPHASADTVHAAIDKLITNVKKKAPKNVGDLAEMAEATFYADTARFWSDEIYLPFARAAATNKKVPSAQRERFAAHTLVLENSQEGMKIPSLVMTLRDGTKSNLDSLASPCTIVLFESPGCTDCSLTRARLAANISVKQLIDARILRVADIYMNKPDAAWKESVGTLPANWTVAACPEAERYVDMRVTPAIYMLDKENRILYKHMTIDRLLSHLESVVNRHR